MYGSIYIYGQTKYAFENEKAMEKQNKTKNPKQQQFESKAWINLR